MNDLWPWVALCVLGGFHGLNPAMGWLFAVSLGFQERRLRAVVTALGPISLGHALSIGLVAIPVGLLGLAIPRSSLLLLGGVALLGFAAYKIATRFRHPRWVGLRIRGRELALWSFLMATAHGAGLMLVPVLVRLREGTGSGGPASAGAQDVTASASGHAQHVAMTTGGHSEHQSVGSDALLPALAATTLHTVAMLLVMGVLALLVYQRLGVDALRRAWINLDFVWVGTLALAGSITLALGFWSLLVG
jgi:hypothetical protein